MSTLNKVTMQLGSNYPYMFSMFNEQMDKTVTEAKAEIESHLQARMEDVALKAIGKSQELEALPEEDQDIEEDGGMLMGGM